MRSMVIQTRDRVAVSSFLISSLFLPPLLLFKNVPICLSQNVLNSFTENSVKLRSLLQPFAIFSSSTKSSLSRLREVSLRLTSVNLTSLHCSSECTHFCRICMSQRPRLYTLTKPCSHSAHLELRPGLI